MSLRWETWYSFMQRYDARFNNLARQIFERVCTFNRGIKQNQDGMSSSEQKFVQPNDDYSEGVLRRLPPIWGFNNLLRWLNRCEQFFHNERKMEAYKVGLFAFYLTGEAWFWFYILEQMADVQRELQLAIWSSFVK